jgi:MFS family permease
VLVVAGASIATLAAVSYTISESIGVLIGARLVQGIGEAAFWVGIATLVTDLTPEARRGEGISYFSVAVYLGAAVGPALGEVALDAGGYDAVWIAVAVMFAGAALIGLRCPDARPATPPAARVLLPRTAVVPGAVLFLGVSGLTGFSAFVPLYGDDLGLDDVSLIFVVYGLLVLAIRVFAARLPDRLGPLRTGSAAVVFLAVGFGVMAAWASVTGLIVATIFVALGTSMLYPGVMTLALIGVADNERALVVGTVSAFFDLAAAFGGLLLGVIASAAGFRGAFAAGAVLSVGALVLLRSGLDPRARRGASLSPSEQLHQPEIAS